ncbi:hypothetical protein M422DRAFT_773793 [Sphaerobolus stellatus SS14]|nr:hypothetical protein M422DRAFT_773793 [Sphaerobolus stellatus SS14]
MLFTSWQRWSAALLALSSLCTTVHSASPSFENTAVVRTIELDGALTHITTRYSARALVDGVKEYTFSLGKEDGESTTWAEARVKDSEVALPLKENGYDWHTGVWSYTASLPKSLKVHGDIILEFDTVQSNAGKAVPAAIAQGEPESLEYSVDLFILSPYSTSVQRTKIRTPSTQVHSYTKPKVASALLKDDLAATKSGATITYGPFQNIPVSTASEFLKKTQQRVSVHYQIEHPVLRVLSLHRTAEVSHWGSNLNIQDEIHLKNDGPKLKGQFSRLTHQILAYQKLPTYGTLISLTLHLPPGISAPYYYDLIGNVSTSKFRPSPAHPKTVTLKHTPPTARSSVLEFKPRYPLLGGWNYTFTLGWDAPLADSVKFDSKSSRYILGVPFWTPISTASVDEAEVQVILPEGATDVEIYEPFNMDSVTRTTQTTYLDTVGRPTIIFKKKGLTDNHTGAIYVSYKVPLSAHLKKPVAVGTAMFGIFIFGLFVKRLDPRIQRNKK